MTLRTLALVLAALLSVPAALVLLRPGRPGDDDGEMTADRRLDAFWNIVPLALILALIVLAAAA